MHKKHRGYRLTYKGQVLGPDGCIYPVRIEALWPEGGQITFRVSLPETPLERTPFGTYATEAIRAIAAKNGITAISGIAETLSFGLSPACMYLDRAGFCTHADIFVRDVLKQLGVADPDLWMSDRSVPEQVDLVCTGSTVITYPEYLKASHRTREIAADA